MTRYPWILLLGFCLAPQMLAVEPGPAVGDKSERNAELSTDLKQFVRGAIDEGLLTPVKPADPAPARAGLSDDTAAAMPPEPVPEKPQVMRARESACTGLYALDFSDLQRIDSYQELYAVRDSIDAAADQGGAPGTSTGLAKTHIALGLYSEALVRPRSNDVGRYGRVPESSECTERVSQAAAANADRLCSARNSGTRAQ